MVHTSPILPARTRAPRSLLQQCQELYGRVASAQTGHERRFCGPEVHKSAVHGRHDSPAHRAYQTDRFGDGVKEHLASSKKRWQGATRADADRFLQEWQDIVTRATELFTANTPVDAPETQELIDRHYRWIRLSWTPDRESYSGLADLYLEDEFRSQLDAQAEGVAEWSNAAMKHYAQTRL